ncbi:hypothetical protein D3C85_1122630 [compost metagenome]
MGADINQRQRAYRSHSNGEEVFAIFELADRDVHRRTSGMRGESFFRRAAIVADLAAGFCDLKTHIQADRAR